MPTTVATIPNYWAEALERVAALQAARPAPPKKDPIDPALLRTAVGLCDFYRIKLKDEARALLSAEASPRTYFDRLMEKQCAPDAIRVLARILPPRRALWWGCLCAWEAYRPEPSEPALTAALQATVRWVREPNEDNRRAAELTGWAARPNRLAGILALGAFLSGGSISKPGLPFVGPDPRATPRLAGVAVLLAAAMCDPVRLRQYYRHFLEIGVDMARGVNLWTESGRVATPGVNRFAVDQLIAVGHSPDPPDPRSPGSAWERTA